jgi:hypothetical protein
MKCHEPKIGAVGFNQSPVDICLVWQRTSTSLIGRLCRDCHGRPLSVAQAFVRRQRTASGTARIPLECAGLVILQFCLAWFDAPLRRAF